MQETQFASNEPLQSKHDKWQLSHFLVAGFSHFPKVQSVLHSLFSRNLPVGHDKQSLAVAPEQVAQVELQLLHF